MSTKIGYENKTFNVKSGVAFLSNSGDVSGGQDSFLVLAKHLSR